MVTLYNAEILITKEYPSNTHNTIEVRSVRFAGSASVYFPRTMMDSQSHSQSIIM